MRQRCAIFCWESAVLSPFSSLERQTMAVPSTVWRAPSGLTGTLKTRDSP